MKNLYLYLNSQDSIRLYNTNSPSECRIQLPKSYILEGSWSCALVDISLDCHFSPKSNRLYLCCDFVEDSYVKESLLPVLRNVEINNRYRKLKTELYTYPLYVPLKTSNLHTVRIYLLDETLQPVEFTTNQLQCVLHLKKT